MEALDLSLPVRQGVVAHLKTKQLLTSKVAASSIYGEQPKGEPKWPFIRIGFQAPAPWMATGLSGTASTFSIDAFSKGPFTDAIYEIAAAVVDAMKDFKLAGYDLRDLQWTGTNYLRDTDEAGAYHAVIGYYLIATRTD